MWFNENVIFDSLWKDFESVAPECSNAVRQAFYQLKELAEQQGKSLLHCSFWVQGSNKFMQTNDKNESKYMLDSVAKAVKHF